jgi:two-component sensor histidine kinase
MQSVAKTLSLTFRAEPDSVSSARTALGDFAREAGSVYVTAALVAEELWVLVADDGCGLEPRTGRPGLGLGLGLIAQLSDELAIVPRAGGGTEVRMRFNLIRTESRESGGGPDAFRARPSFA